MIKFLKTSVVALSVLATNANAATDMSFVTKGDMTDTEILAVLDLRRQFDDIFSATDDVRDRLGSAMTASIFGVVLEAGALATGVVKSVQNRSADAKIAADLEKLSEEDLNTTFANQFMEDCKADLEKNPATEEVIAEDGTVSIVETDVDVACEKMLANFYLEGTREAKIEYLAGTKSGTWDKNSLTNWIRMGAAAGGAIASGVAAGVISGAAKDLESINEDKNKKWESALDNFRSVQMQARLEKRTENPMAEIVANCRGVNLKTTQSNLEKAKWVPISGTILGVGAAATSGLQNVNALGGANQNNKVMNLASNITSGAATVASGVTIGIVASNQKNLRKAVNDMLSCEEWLWWDDNGHAFEVKAKSGYDWESTPENERQTLWASGICPFGAQKENNRCAWCFNYSGNPYIEKMKNPGVTCEVEKCASGFEKVFGYQDTNGIRYDTCVKPCNIQNGTTYQQWYKGKLLACGEEYSLGLEHIIERGFVKCNQGYEAYSERPISPGSPGLFGCRAISKPVEEDIITVNTYQELFGKCRGFSGDKQRCESAKFKIPETSSPGLGYCNNSCGLPWPSFDYSDNPADACEAKSDGSPRRFLVGTNFQYGGIYDFSLEYAPGKIVGKAMPVRFRNGKIGCYEEDYFNTPSGQLMKSKDNVCTYRESDGACFASWVPIFDGFSLQGDGSGF